MCLAGQFFPNAVVERAGGTQGDEVALVDDGLGNGVWRCAEGQKTEQHGHCADSHVGNGFHSAPHKGKATVTREACNG